MSAFAENHLKKLGWEEGKGLGKNEDGIAVAIKPKLKFDTAGIGHDIGKQFTNHWWEVAYNKTAKKISVENTTNGVEISTKEDEPKERKKELRNQVYSSFVKSGFLENDAKQEISSSSSESEEECSTKTAESIFNELQGVTAHKAARLGIKMNGKLKRIQEHEQKYLKSLNKKSKKNLMQEKKSKTCRKKKRKKKDK